MTSSAVTLLRPEGAAALSINRSSIEDSASIPIEQLELGVVLTVGRRCVLLLHAVSGDPQRENEDLGLVGESAVMHRLRREIKKLGPLAVPVLIRGATGSGKELVAQAIHRAGPRVRQPFMAVNVATLASGVAASELFGHAKGAFTGAVADHAGYFQRADKGTLFLDEIGEASIEVQTLLLRTLETSIVQPIGGVGERAVDVRLLTATDADLEGAVEKGAFREPLVHRLSGFVVRLPRLSERREDLGRLLVHFMEKEATSLGVAFELGDEQNPWLSPETVARLALYEWPGNVRQLRNVARQLLVAREEGPEAIEEVLSELERPQKVERPPERAESIAKAARRPADVADEEIIKTLANNGWRMERAAAELGISRTSLYRRIDKIPELKKSKDLSTEQIEAAMAGANNNISAAAKMLRVSEPGLRLRLGELKK